MTSVMHTAHWRGHGQRHIQGAQFCQQTGGSGALCESERDSAHDIWKKRSKKTTHKCTQDLVTI